ncbi:MAG: sulfatase-like hydrolase/transferase [Lachnospiraceae bacterium]|nr:sulfatase-like hydrolase/transferase [Lachnospiraceae bacterium]
MKKVFPNFRLSLRLLPELAVTAAALVLLFVYRGLFFAGARVIKSTSSMNPAVDIPLETHRALIFYVLIGLVVLAVVDGLFSYFGRYANKKRVLFSTIPGTVIGLLAVVASSVLFFYEIELINNYYLVNMKPKYVRLNILITLILTLVLVLLFNSVTRGLQIAAIFFVVWGTANYFVQRFRGSPLQWVDFSAIRTAANVANNYSYQPNWEVIACWVLNLTYVQFLEHRHVRCNFGKLPLKILSRGAGVAVLAAFYMMIFRTNCLSDQGIWLRDWQPWYTYRLFGVESGFFAFAKASFPEAPESYSGAETKRIIQTSESEETEDNSSLPVPENIICIMNESFSDLTIYPNFKTDVELTPVLKSLKENTQSGRLLASVKGGTTCNTEYEFLTGNSCVLSPSTVVFTSFIKDKQYSIARTLADQGYTAIALHPYKRSGWSRTTVYPRMGFSDFLSIENSFEGAEKVRGYVSDSGDYQELIRQVENKKEGEKLFLFNVTMQNHSSYKDKDFESTAHVLDYNGANQGQADQFCSLMQLSDQAIGELLDYFSKSDQKTLICFWGDHQPEIGDDFWEYCLGKDLDRLTFDEQQLLYETPYFIWANYDIPEAQDQTMSANYLSSYLLSLTGLELTGYNRYLLNQKKVIPAMNAYGYLSEDGIARAWGSADAGQTEEEKLEQYRCLIYNELTAGKARDESFFGIS